SEEMENSLGLELDNVLSQILEGKTMAQIQGLDEGHLDAIYSVAENQLNAGEIENAASLFQLLILLDPTVSRFYTAFGACQQLMNKFEYALELYTLAQLYDMNDPRVPQNAALCCIHLGRLSEAHGMANRALGLCETILDEYCQKP